MVHLEARSRKKQVRTGNWKYSIVEVKEEESFRTKLVLKGSSRRHAIKNKLEKRHVG